MSIWQSTIQLQYHLSICVCQQHDHIHPWGRPDLNASTASVSYPAQTETLLHNQLDVKTATEQLRWVDQDVVFAQGPEKDEREIGGCE